MSKYSLYAILVLWVGFVFMVYNKLHMQIYDIKNFHGQFMGESYLVASLFSKILFLTVLFLIVGSVALVVKRREVFINLLAILLGSLWIVYFYKVTKKVPYFF